MREFNFCIATDGSVLQTNNKLKGIGAGGIGAIIVDLNNGETLYEGGEPCGFNNTSYDTEIKALTHGLQKAFDVEIIQRIRKKNILIITDSKSAIDRLKIGNVEQTIESDLTGALTNLAKFANITIQHTRGHTDINLNNKCDMIAKEYAKQQTQLKPTSSPTLTKQALQALIKSTHREERINELTKIIYKPQIKQYFKRTKGFQHRGKYIKNPDIYAIQNQLIAGTNETAITKAKRKYIPSTPDNQTSYPFITKCEHCGTDLGHKSQHSSYHIVYECTKWNSQRTAFFNVYRRNTQLWILTNFITLLI